MHLHATFDEKGGAKMDAQKFGTFVAECRKEKNMTQADLAIKLDVTDKAISRWERGVGFPDINTIEPLADALEISVLELMKSEKISTNEVARKDATEIISNTLSVAKFQRKQERKNIFAIISGIAVIVILTLFLDSLQWRADTFIFTMIGVVLPMLCVCSFIALIIYGICRKRNGKSSKQTFIIALICFLVSILIFAMFALVGALGIGPIPQ
jgi:transcriptional regulator with XRE-family HTH domain